MSLEDLQYDPTSKKLSTAPGADSQLIAETDQLNSLVKDVIAANADVPPAPAPQNFSKNMSVMVQKMHTSATNHMKQRKFKDAAKQYGIALGLALARPKYENFQLSLSEVIACLMGRCDAFMMSQDYMSGYLDAELLCQLAPTVPDNHLRKGICELKLNNILDAKTDFERGLCFKPGHAKLQEHLTLAESIIAAENGD